MSACDQKMDFYVLSNLIPCVENKDVFNFTPSFFFILPKLLFCFITNLILHTCPRQSVADQIIQNLHGERQEHIYSLIQILSGEYKTHHFLCDGTSYWIYNAKRVENGHTKKISTGGT
jgi:hypothetical protein